MSIQNSNQQHFGLDISDKNIKFVQANPFKGKHKLQAWGQVNLKPGLIVDGEIIDKEKVVQAAKELKKKTNGHLNTNLVVASLPEAKTFLKLFTLQKTETPKADSQLESETDSLVTAIEIELPREIPLAVNNLVYDYHLIEESKSSWKVLVGAVPRDVVLELTELIKAMGFQPVALELEAQAITRVLLTDYIKEAKKTTDNPLSKLISKLKTKLTKEKPKKKSTKPVKAEQAPVVKNTPELEHPFIVVDLGATHTNIIVFDQKTIKLTRTIELSGNSLTQLIAQKLGVTEAKAEQAKITSGINSKDNQAGLVIGNWVKVFSKELKSTLEYYAKECHQEVADIQVLLSGGASGLSGLSEKLGSDLGASVVIANPLQKIVYKKGLAHIPDLSLRSYTTAIGLAIR